MGLFIEEIMRQFVVIFSVLFLLTACVSSETTITKNNPSSGGKTKFDPKAAAEIRVKLAVGHLEKDNMAKAKENLEKALEYEPNNADIYRVFGYYYQRVNENEEAEEQYKKSLSLDKNNARTYGVYGAFLCKQERYEEAETAFLKAIKVSNYTGVANIYENAATCSEKSGNIDKALSYYKSALSHNPKKTYLNLTLAKILIDKKEYKNARANLFQFQKSSGVTAESLWQWIRVSYATGKSASLNKYATALLTDFPESEQALHYLNHDYE